jgi:hypothetical protein
MSRGWFTELSCERAEDFLQAISPTGELSRKYNFQSDRWVFRGQGDARWGLCPSVFRPQALATLTAHTAKQRASTPLDHAEIEIEGVLRFAVMADRAGFPLPGDAPALRDPRVEHPRVDLMHFPPTEYLQVTALAQHYGIPTRLLDWTTKPLVAGYFAAWDCIHCNGGRTHLAVWGLSSAFVARTGPKRDPAFFVFTAPAATNPNLHAQGGMFTLVQPRSEESAAEPLPDLDRLLFELDAGLKQERSPVFVKFTLPVSEARVFVRLLADSGVSAATIFPGLSGVARAFFEARDWK